jgi:hypothetical protein
LDSLRGTDFLLDSGTGFLYPYSLCQNHLAELTAGESHSELRERMAQKVNIILVDDLDGSDATETVSFGLDGTSYEIDLSDKNAAQLRDALSGYVGHARKVTSSRKRKASSTTTGPSARELRDWARSNGFEVSDRGRVPAEVREAFDAAH